MRSGNVWTSQALDKASRLAHADGTCPLSPCGTRLGNAKGGLEFPDVAYIGTIREYVELQAAASLS